jgi:hypothetical protein
MVGFNMERGRFEGFDAEDCDRMDTKLKQTEVADSAPRYIFAKTE